MYNLPKPLPLSLYVHIPWCVRKCPYCDFNSHEAKTALPEQIYINNLLKEVEGYLPLIEGRPLVSIFFGGGTPSLFSGPAIAEILDGIAKKITFTPDIEITLEANPGTIDQARFMDFRKAGVNRLSLGIQSLQDDKLKSLGRIHDRENAIRAIEYAKEAFTNFNLDLMYGLPNQSIEDALLDLESAIVFEPTHLSWYQLTIEPNTLFHHKPPTLPLDDDIWEMQIAGQNLLHKAGFQQYEVSAYSQINKECRHNLNYWEFGDYLGIGAGAHSKITMSAVSSSNHRNVVRFSQIKHPKDYLLHTKQPEKIPINESSLIFEFMLNALRLTKGVPTDLFEERTGLYLSSIEETLASAKKRNLLLNDSSSICPSDLGKRFLNDLVGLFLR
jgi:putative oxygen-independent coproporphyrinogen III oxidase